MNEVLEQHLARLKAGTVSQLSRGDLPRWIEKNTYVDGKPFSFKHHEYQERIAGDLSQEINIQKPSQIGISELAMRMALGLLSVYPGSFRIGYVFPTASFSSQYSKTRLNPIIQSSPSLRSAVNTSDLDSAEVRTFGPGKELYFKGAASGNSAISTTLDCIFFDEYSFMDQGVAGDYHSRLTHSQHRIKIRLSTPQFPGCPISAAVDASKRWINLCKCNHCNQYFAPEYYEQVRIPGFNGHLDEINADNLKKYKYKQAQLFCPHCGKVPNLMPAHREFVCENPDDDYEATGYKLSPFDAPKIISVPYLIHASTSYENKSKFRQFNLGVPSVNADAGITEEDLDAIGREIAQTPFTSHVMGIDVGMISHFAVGGVDDKGLGVVHYERVPLPKFRERYWALKAQYKISVTCMDMQPYSDLAMSLASEDPNLYACVFVTRIGLDLYNVVTRDADFEGTYGALRQVQMNRNAIFDKFLSDIRDGRVWIAKREDWPLVKSHLMDMKRATATLRNGEFTSQWQKSSKKQDHYHHTIGAYLATAAAMRGVASSQYGQSMGLKTFKLREPKSALVRQGVGW